MNCLWKRLTDVMENEDLYRKLEKMMGRFGQILISTTSNGYIIQLSPDLSGAAGGDASKEAEGSNLAEALKKFVEQ